MRGWLVGLGFLSVLSPGAPAAEGYYRHPDLHGDQVVFVAEGDLWLAPLSGGLARRVSSHPGGESFPRFSPDGQRIAFTAEYDGNDDVYVVDAAGGEPRRLTWHPAADQVVGWTPAGEILFRSSRDHAHGMPELYRLAVGAGEPHKLPLGWASRVEIDPRSGRWAFTRTSVENATWKRYRGGMAPDIWVGHPDREDWRAVTSTAAIDAHPMWHRDRIFFLSDHGGTQNVWSMAADGTDRRRHTSFDRWDARWPAMGPDGRIVFSLAADLHVFDPATESERRIDVVLPSDRARTRVRYPDAGEWIAGFDLSPDAKRLAVVARGEVFSVPVESGVTLPVTSTATRERDAVYHPKGERLIWVGDATGEEALVVGDAWGRGETRSIDTDSRWHATPAVSPDGDWIAWGDETHALRVVPLAGGSSKVVDRSLQGEIREYAFSPDGRWLAYTKTEDPTGYASLFLFDTREGKSHRVTDATTHDGSPAWDPEGKWLAFVSSRAINPITGAQDWQSIEVRSDRLYLVVLADDDPGPLARREGLPPSAGDESKAEAKRKDGKKKDEDDDGEDEEPEPVKIDLEGLAGRVIELPVDRGNYGGLGAAKGRLFYLSFPLRGMAETPGLFADAEPEASLMVFDFEEREEKTFLEGVAGYTLAAGADRIAVAKKRGEIHVLDTTAEASPESLAEGRVDLSGVVVEVDPREEWKQIFREAWRQMREFYWDAGMGGIDWEAEHDKYAALLPRVATRSDLNDLLGELIGELGTSHTYVFGGDPGVEVEGVPTGLLGARFERSGDAYRVTRIFRGAAADNVRSPLEEPGVNVRVGDYLLAVNHRPFAADRPIEAAFANLAGRDVVLTVNTRPSRDGAREVVVRPLASEGELIYSDWVRANREHVAERTGGRIGYLHLPDMWQDGLIEFDTWFYPQLDLEGMIVDVRWNGGGAVSQMILERLRRPLLSFDRSRGGALGTYPARTLNGPFVVLTNEFAGSDGDIFPMAVQLEGLAPVIGARSWGGVVGIRLDKTLVDRGIVTSPEFAWWDPEHGWDLENRGVIPDVEVQNLPQDLARGRDPQLERAIDEVLRLHELHPPVVPRFGPPRDRSREAFRDEALD